MTNKQKDTTKLRRATLDKAATPPISLRSSQRSKTPSDSNNEQSSSNTSGSEQRKSS